jgi:hypothetical protein
LFTGLSSFLQATAVVVYVRGLTCLLVIFYEARHRGAESDRMSALRVRVARKVYYMRIDDAAAGDTFNETLWGCFRCLWLWKKPLRSKATPSHAFGPPVYMMHDNTNTAFDKDSVANGVVEDLAADVFDVCYGYKGIQPHHTAPSYSPRQRHHSTRRC